MRWDIIEPLGCFAVLAISVILLNRASKRLRAAEKHLDEARDLLAGINEVQS